MNYNIREITTSDFDDVKRLLKEHWGSEKVVSKGKIHDASTLPGFIAKAEDKILGLLTFRKENGQIEIVTLNSFAEGIGIGTALLKSVNDIAVKNDIKRIWLITTNDNTPAIKFYQKRGFNIAAFHKNAIEFSRKLKPEIPEIGLDGIPIRDEIEFELWL